MAIERVDLPSYKIVIFHSYVSLPEGIGINHIISDMEIGAGKNGSCYHLGATNYQ